MHINPSELSSTELRSIVAMSKHNRPAMISCGFVIIGDTFINWKVIKSICEKGLIVKHINGTVELTIAGNRIAKQFCNRPILGYD